LHITYELSLYKQIQTENPTPLIGVERGGGGPQLSGARPPAGLPVSRALIFGKILTIQSI
jgi:hypothetical protein